MMAILVTVRECKKMIINEDKGNDYETEKLQYQQCTSILSYFLDQGAKTTEINPQRQ